MINRKTRYNASITHGDCHQLRFGAISQSGGTGRKSGLNNLEDITLDPRYSALYGYTQAELEQHFGEHLQGADTSLVRSWYNGYNWLGESVYNPLGVLPEYTLSYPNNEVRYSLKCLLEQYNTASL